MEEVLVRVECAFLDDSGEEINTQTQSIGTSRYEAEVEEHAPLTRIEGRYHHKTLSSLRHACAKEGVVDYNTLAWLRRHGVCSCTCVVVSSSGCLCPNRRTFGVSRPLCSFLSPSPIY